MTDHDVLKYLEQTATVDIYKNTGKGRQVLTLVSKNSVTYCKRINQRNALAVLDGECKERFYLKQAAKSPYKVDVFAHPNIYIGNIDDLKLSLENGLYKQRCPARNRGEDGEFIYKIDDNQITVAKQVVTCSIQMSEDVTQKALLVAFGIYCSMIQHGPYVDPTEDDIISNQIRRTYKHELDVSRFSELKINSSVKKTDNPEVEGDSVSSMSKALPETKGRFDEVGTPIINGL